MKPEHFITPRFDRKEYMKKYNKNYHQSHKNMNTQEAGKLGGKKTKALYGREHFVKAGKLGGRPRNKVKTQTKLKVNDGNMATNKDNSAIHR